MIFSPFFFNCEFNTKIDLQLKGQKSVYKMFFHINIQNQLIEKKIIIFGNFALCSSKIILSECFLTC